MKVPNLLIIGMAQHGKDALADILCELNPEFVRYSSSQLAAELFIFDALKDKYGYQTIGQCMEDRVNHRKEWHDLITEFNTPDPTRLARNLLDRANIYVGMRSKVEIDACREEGLFDSIIWVDASKRVPPESEESCKVDEFDADWIIDNNEEDESLEILRANAHLLLTEITGEVNDLL